MGCCLGTTAEFLLAIKYQPTICSVWIARETGRDASRCCYIKIDSDVERSFAAVAVKGEEVSWL